MSIWLIQLIQMMKNNINNNNNIKIMIKNNYKIYNMIKMMKQFLINTIVFKILIK